MKKKLSILSLSMVPALAFAAGTAMTGSTTVTANNCTLLQDDLKIGLSSGVVGGYSCDSVTTNTISISSCHTGGRVTSRTSTVQLPSGCGGTNTAVPCTGTTASTVSGTVVPSATTAGGSMTNNFPGGTCDTGGAKAAGVL
jgi:hypothetical protein